MSSINWIQNVRFLLERLVFIAVILLSMKQMDSNAYRHMCKPIQYGYYDLLNIQSMFFISRSRLLVIVESDEVYTIPVAHKQPRYLVMPATSNGKWYEHISLFGSAKQIKHFNIQLINQFDLGGTLVTMYYTFDNYLLFSTNNNLKMEKFVQVPISTAVVVANEAGDGYVLQLYPDNYQYGTKDLLMACNLTTNQKSKINLDKVETLFNEVLHPSLDRYTMKVIGYTKMTFYSRIPGKYVESFRSLPVGFIIDSTVYLIDVIVGKVYVFEYTNLADSYSPNKVFHLPLQTYSLHKFFNCSEHI